MDVYHVTVVAFVLLTVVGVYLIVKYQHPDDKNDAYLPKLVVLFGFVLSGATVLMLPLNVANNEGYAGCDGFDTAICGGINMTLFWTVIYWLIPAWVFLLIPFSIFFYEADDGMLIYSWGEISDELRSKITSIRVGPQVEDIPDGTFKGCRNLTEVQFAHEGALRVIGNCAFYGCTALQQVSIPPSVTELGSESFWGCRNLTEVQFAHEGALRVIGNCAFYGCTALQQVSIPPSVTELGYGAFMGCRNVTEVQFAHEGALQVIENSAFFGCTALQRVSITPIVTKLGRYAFTDCRNLTNVRFHEGALQVIGNYAFDGCRALQQVSIPPSVTELGDGAFGDCSNLTEVQFAHAGALQVIGNYAFLDCTALQQVLIPPSVTELGEEAFGGCSNLAELILLGDGFLDLDHLSGEAALNKTKINEMFGPGLSAFHNCELTPGMHATICGRRLITIKIEFSQCMARLPEECRRSVEGEIPDMHRLELTQDGNIFASYPVVRRSSGDMDVQDTNNRTAASLHRLLRLMKFHELKESSILAELAVWKSRIDQATTPVPPEERSEYRVSIPDPARCLIMEYCGFTDLLEPAIEGG